MTIELRWKTRVPTGILADDCASNSTNAYDPLRLPPPTSKQNIQATFGTSDFLTTLKREASRHVGNICPAEVEPGCWLVRWPGAVKVKSP